MFENRQCLNSDQASREEALCKKQMGKKGWRNAVGLLWGAPAGDCDVSSLLLQGLEAFLAGASNRTTFAWCLLPPTRLPAALPGVVLSWQRWLGAADALLPPTVTPSLQRLQSEGCLRQGRPLSWLGVGRDFVRSSCASNTKFGMTS